MAKVFLGLGSNVGDRGASMKKAVEMLEDNGVTVIKHSPLYETEPVDMEDQDWFYNKVIEVKTDLDPEKLLVIVKEIEQAIGRKFTYRYGPRVIDIDILIYGGEIVENSVLKIPHTEMTKRNFVLIPFNEIAPEVVHPVKNKTIKELLNACKDTSIVRPL